MVRGFVCRAHSSPRTCTTAHFKKWQRCGRPALIITESICLSSSLCPRDGHRLALVNTGSLSLATQTPWSLRKPLQPGVLRNRALFLLITSHGLSLAKQHEGKKGGDTQGGRGWRSKLIPHVPQEETFQAARAYSAGGRVAEYSKLWEHLAALSRTFRPHTAAHWIHMDPFSSTMASQGTIYFSGKHRSSRKSLLQRNQTDLK